MLLKAIGRLDLRLYYVTGRCVWATRPPGDGNVHSLLRWPVLHTRRIDLVSPREGLIIIFATYAACYSLAGFTGYPVFVPFLIVLDDCEHRGTDRMTRQFVILVGFQYMKFLFHFFPYLFAT